MNRFSALALGSVVVLVVTGGFQAWRQVGSLEALKDTDFGRLLLAKLVVFAAMVVAAAFSREVVNRHFRGVPDDDELLDGESEIETARVPALVSVRGRGAAARATATSPATTTAASGATTPSTSRPTRRRRAPCAAASSVEIVFAVVVLAITALLVNAAPAAHRVDRSRSR